MEKLCQINRKEQNLEPKRFSNFIKLLMDTQENNVRLFPTFNLRVFEITSSHQKVELVALADKKLWLIIRLILHAIEIVHLKSHKTSSKMHILERMG